LTNYCLSNDVDLKSEFNNLDYVVGILQSIISIEDDKKFINNQASKMNSKTLFICYDSQIDFLRTIYKNHEIYLRILN